MGEFRVNTLRGEYPVIIQPGVRTRLREMVLNLQDIKRLAIVTDENVASIYRESLEYLLGDDGKSIVWITIPSGEKSKNLQNFESITRTLFEEGFRRSDVICAFGGGVVSDLAGFVASTYMRGIRWICVPTTLLAQADASIGGKVGIHFDGIKNVIGTFHQTSFVMSDPEFLLTLSERHFISGLAEVMKMALLPGGENSSIWDKEIRDSALKRDPVALEKIISDSCVLKIQIVEHDEFDHAGRIILNLGHTLGHALESSGSLYKFSHGEAVCVGILFIVELALNDGDMSQEDVNKIYELFTPVALSVPSLDMSWDDLAIAIEHDKKRKSENPVWIYPMGIGKISIREIDIASAGRQWDNFRDKFTGWCASAKKENR